GVEIDADKIDARPPEHPLRRRGILGEDADPLVAREDPDDLGVGPRDGLEPARPVRLVVGPRDPGRAVGGPLGGHRDPARGHRFSRLRSVMEPYASIRRSRRNGQCCRAVSTTWGSTSATSTSGLFRDASAMVRPYG